MGAAGSSPVLTPRRHGFRWSLRTVFLVITFVATLLGVGLTLAARAERLAERANWHDREASRFSFSAKLATIGGLGLPGVRERDEARQREEQAIADNHRAMAAECRQAIWRPWIQPAEPPSTRSPASWIEP